MRQVPFFGLQFVQERTGFCLLILRGAIVNMTKYCQQKQGNMYVFVCTVGPINYGSP